MLDEVHHGGFAEKHVVHLKNAHLAFFHGKLGLTNRTKRNGFHRMTFGKIHESGNGLNSEHVSELGFFIHGDDGESVLPFLEIGGGRGGERDHGLEGNGGEEWAHSVHFIRVILRAGLDAFSFSRIGAH